ncbi:MAG: hypothetical protein K6B52_09685 [Clostridiales bacterium]|nr:hypothetical protein [Clostridiales bacterium]
MIYLIVGNKGSGKTKKLIEFVNTAVENSKGHVVCIEKERLLTYDINYRARLIETDHYNVSGYDALYGFIAGVLAGDNDITNIFVDATLKIGGRDMTALTEFIKKISALSGRTNQDITFTISADESEIPADILNICEKI